MADDKFQTARDSATTDDNDLLLNGTPEQRLKTWLKLTKDESGHYKAGVRFSLRPILTRNLTHMLTSPRTG